jgi:hypothetical protein
MRLIDLSCQVKFHNLLVAIEGREETCVIRMISPKPKIQSRRSCISRSCLGLRLRSRRQRNAIARPRSLSAKPKLQMLSSDVIVDTYKIDDKTAIAASSIFHGELYEPQCMMTRY